MAFEHVFQFSLVKVIVMRHVIVATASVDNHTTTYEVRTLKLTCTISILIDWLSNWAILEFVCKQKIANDGWAAPLSLAAVTLYDVIDNISIWRAWILSNRSAMLQYDVPLILDSSNDSSVKLSTYLEKTLNDK